MTVQTGAGAPQAGDQQGSGQGQAPPAGGQGQAPGQQGQQVDGVQAILNRIPDPDARGYIERQLRDLADARREAGDYRTRLRDAEDKVTQYERGKLSDQQRLEAERDDWKTKAEDALNKLAQRDRMDAVTTAAGKANAINPATVARMIAGQVEVDKDGKPTNLDALITELKRTDAYLFRRTDADAGAGSGPGTSGPAKDHQDMNRQLRQLAGRE
jgi:hypothetical protein